MSAFACTYRQLADVTFDPIDGLESADHEANFQKVLEVARIAVDLLGKTKPELIEFVEATSKKGLLGAMFEGVRDGKEKLEVMLEFVTAAQLRVAAATAVIYPKELKSSR